MLELTQLQFITTNFDLLGTAFRIASHGPGYQKLAVVC
jgi:hypothetical protein